MGSAESHFNVSLNVKDKATSSVHRVRSPFSSKVVVCGHCLVALSLTVNEVLLELTECCFMSTKNIGLLGTGAQDGHLDCVWFFNCFNYITLSK